MFLGLRLNQGVSLEQLRGQFGPAVSPLDPILADLEGLGLIDRNGGTVRLSDRGRLLSNEVFERLIAIPAVMSTPEF